MATYQIEVECIAVAQLTGRMGTAVVTYRGHETDGESIMAYRINPNTLIDIEVLVRGAWTHLFRAHTREYATDWLSP